MPLFQDLSQLSQSASRFNEVFSSQEEAHLCVVLGHAAHEVHDLDCIGHWPDIAVLEFAEENVQLLVVEVLCKVTEQVVDIVLHSLKGVHLQYKLF